VLLAVELPHGEFLVFGIFFFIVGAGLVALARFFPDTSKPIVTAVSPIETLQLNEPEATWEPQTAQGAAPAIAAQAITAQAITWPALVDPAAGVLDDAERRRVIDGLGVVGDAWCASILTKAFEEEEGDLRVAAIESLGHCTTDVAPSLQRAYASDVVPERYAAVDGASRRSDIKLLERALHDADTTVALAAAYGLQRANRNDVIENNLVARIDEPANEIRRVLELLA